jgi:probable selenium-dependent hydroxylase accessory protein YqeC
MRLLDALGVDTTGALACVGAGGKTTICWRAWLECRSPDSPAIFSTTTHILEPVLPPDAALYLSREPDPAHIRALALRATGIVLAAARLPDVLADVTPNPIAPSRPVKLSGLQAEQIDRLIEQAGGVTWLIEADGARGRSLKVPAAHEPVIPSRVSAVAILAHLDAIDQPLDEALAHRADRVAEYFGMAIGDCVTDRHLVRLLTDPHGGLKGVPAGARVAAILNQREERRLHPQAQTIARSLLASGRYARVIVAALRAKQPVLEVFK